MDFKISMALNILHLKKENPAARPKEVQGKLQSFLGTLNRLRYLRLDALMGLTFCFLVSVTVLTWVAMLQLPFFHFKAGSGAATQ